MPRKSRVLYTTFLWLLLASLLSITFQAAMTVLLPDMLNANLWIHAAIFISAFFIAFLTGSRRFSGFVTFLFNLLIFAIVFIGLKYIFMFVLPIPKTAYLSDFILAIFASFLFIILFLFQLRLRGGFDKISVLLAYRERIKEKDAYLSFLSERLGGGTTLAIAKKNAGFLANTAILILITLFFALMLRPGDNILYTIDLLLFGMSGLGIHILGLQAESILTWTVKGVDVPPALSKNWNHLLILLLTLSIGTGLIIPWYFRIFNAETLRQSLQNRFSGLTININNSTSARPKQNTSDGTPASNKAHVYSLSNVTFIRWSHINVSRRAFLSNLNTLKFVLRDPRLSMESYTVEKTGPDILYSDQLNHSSVLILSKNRILARVGTNGSLAVTLSVVRGKSKALIDETDNRSKAINSQYFRLFLILLVGLFGLYLISGIIGGILLLHYRYAKRSALVEFFIRRFHSLKGFLSAFFFVFKLIWRIFAALFGIRPFKRTPEPKLSNPVAKQLFSLFNANKNMSDEKEKEVLSFIREFVRLIDFTGRIIVPYRFYYGPLEYVEKVISYQPELKDILKKIVFLFNESRYSLHILGENKLNEFTRAVDYAIEQLGKSESGILSQSEKS